MLKRTVRGLLLFAFSGVMAAQTGQFLQAPQYSTGVNPQAVVVGDFNNDGNLDLAVANSNDNTVSVLLGKGDGTFSSKANLVTGSTPLGIAAADFNGDGHLDLAVTNSVSDTVSIFLGNGDGSFAAKIDYATGSKPLGVAVADLNGDGHPDLVVTNALSGNVGVLLNKGSGTFNAQVTYNTGFNPLYVAIGDFNNDKIPDLAVANGNNNNVVSVLLGKGDGTFQNQFQSSTGDTPIAIALGDFNGDGNLDMAVADEFGNMVSVLLGNGKGGFAAHVDYATSAFPNAVTTADFNGDGKPDLAISAGNGNTVSILLGNGDGTFQPQVNFGTGDIPYSVVTGDLNNDGKIDLIVANSGGASVSVLMNNGNGTFQARVDYPAGPNPNAVVTADFNGDGFPDLVLANSNCPVFPNCGPGTISIVFGNGNGGFEAPVEYSTGTDTDPYALTVGDFNGDKIPDIAVANYATKTVSVLLGTPAGTFTGHQDYAVGTEPASVANGDFNGDGFADLVVANFYSNTVSVLLNKGTNGNGTFQTAATYSVGHGPISVAVADFNGDHKLDLVVVNETDNNASILLGNGDGTFKAQATYCVVTFANCVGGNPLSVAVGDFNGDGFLDLAVADFQSQQVSILLGNGDGTFQTPKAYSTLANPSSVVIADFNGDGKLDLALTSTPLGSSAGNLVSLLLGKGDGTFSAPALYGTGSEAYSAAVADFNLDGAPDVAVANGISNTVSLLLNIQGTAITFASSGSPSTYGQSVTFTMTVAASVSNGAAPTGSMTVKNGSTVIGSGTLVSGEFKVSTSSLPVGADVLSAVYSGDTNYQPHTVTLTQTVQKEASNTVLVSSANPAGPNQLLTFTATVTSNNTGQPTGTVTFLDGSTIIGSSSVNSSGTATFSTSTLIIGNHSITASYGGDSNFNASTSTVLSQIVKESSSTALSAPASANLNQSVTFTATVTPAGNGAPTGTVTFLDGATQLGSGTLNGAGVAMFSTSTLTAGSHSITADYGGDGTFNSSSSSAVTVVVTSAGFSLTVTALTPGVVAPGGSATGTVTINAVGMSASSVTLACAVSPSVSPAASCSLGAIAGTAATLTFTAASAAQASLASPADHGGSTLFAVGLMIPAMLLGGAGLSKTNRKKLFNFYLLFVVLAGSLAHVACGGSKASTTSNGNTGTPAGIYTIVVTGTANGIQNAAKPVSVTVN
jgi:hypothetical protein